MFCSFPTKHLGRASAEKVDLVINVRSKNQVANRMTLFIQTFMIQYQGICICIAISLEKASEAIFGKEAYDISYRLLL